MFEARKDTEMKRMISMILGWFVETRTEEVEVWEWDSETERQAFIKHFRFCN